jgi:hypothetical protein
VTSCNVLLASALQLFRTRIVAAPMAGGRVLATMLPMNERSFHCVDSIAAVNCTLQAAVGRFER